MSKEPSAVQPSASHPSGQLKPWDPQPVKTILVELGISQHQVAERPGLSLHNLNKMVNGRKAPSLRYVEVLEEATGLPFDELFRLDAYAKCHWYLRRLRAQYAVGGGGRDA